MKSSGRNTVLPAVTVGCEEVAWESAFRENKALGFTLSNAKAAG